MPRDRRCITASIRRRGVAAEFPSYLHERGENAATRELMAMLASGSAEEREAATDWLMNSDPEALPAIEAAAAAMGEGSGGAVAKRIVQTLRPLGAKRAALEARRRDDETWNLREGLESFEKFGVKDRKWDERARTALTHLFSRTKSDNEAELPFSTL